MASIDVLDWNKKSVGKVDLDPAVFETEVRKDILHSVVRWQLASRRQGTVKVKTRGDVRGGGKKPYKQKGTGNARRGSTRSPLIRGGGVIMGPSPRDYSYTLPKKIKKIGLTSALSYLLKSGKLFVVADIKSEAGKTKELATRLGKFGAKKAVLIDTETEIKFGRAVKNLGAYNYGSVAGLNVYDLLKYDCVILSKDALAPIVARCV